MPAQDGAQFSQTVTSTTTGTAVAYGIRAINVLVVNDGTSTAFVDFTQGATVLASTTGASWVLKNGESVSLRAPTNSWYSGLSCIQSAGSTLSSIRILATR